MNHQVTVKHTFGPYGVRHTTVNGHRTMSEDVITINVADYHALCDEGHRLDRQQSEEIERLRVENTMLRLAVGKYEICIRQVTSACGRLAEWLMGKTGQQVPRSRVDFSLEQNIELGGLLEVYLMLANTLQADIPIYSECEKKFYQLVVDCLFDGGRLVQFEEIDAFLSFSEGGGTDREQMLTSVWEFFKRHYRELIREYSERVEQGRRSLLL